MGESSGPKKCPSNPIPKRSKIEKTNNYQVTSSLKSANNYDIRFNNPSEEVNLQNVLFNIDLSLSYDSNVITNRNEKFKTNEVINSVPPTFTMSLVNASPPSDITINYKYYNLLYNIKLIFKSFF